MVAVNDTNWLVSAIFSIDFLVCLLAIVGVYAVCWWLVDNFKSVVQIVRALLTPYFQPQEELTLLERYGSWAGNKNRSGYMTYSLSRYKLFKLVRFFFLV